MSSSNKKKKERALRKSGWLKKKGKKRFFVLVDSWCFWFSKVPAEMKGTAAPTSWSWLSQANGSLYMSRCNVSTTSKDKELVIVNPSSKNYSLIFRDNAERDEWKEVLASMCEVDASDMPAYTDGQLIEKRGCLKWKGEDHWFVLKEGALMWFPSEEDPTLVGSTTLYNATVAVGTTRSGVGFVVATVETKFIVACRDRDEAEEWVSNLKAAIVAAKQARVQGEQEEEAAAHDVGNSHAKVLTEDLMSTKAVYKGHLMYDGSSMAFVLLGDVFMWFKMVQLELSPSSVKKNLKGYVVLHPDRVQLTALPSSTTSPWRYGFQLTSAGVEQQFYAQSTNDRDDWIDEINKTLRNCKEREEKSTASQSEVLEREGWLLRKRVKKWVVVRDNMVHVYDRQGQVGQARTTIPLAGCSVQKAEEDDSPQWMLFTPRNMEVLESLAKKGDARRDRDDWLYVLVKSIARGNQDPALQGGHTSHDGAGGSHDMSHYEQQRSGWLTVSRKKQFFTVRNLSLIWYKSDQLVDYKGSVLLCGCATVLQGSELLLQGSDGKTVLSLGASSPDDASGWALALEEAIQGANEAKGYKRFGYLERKGKQRWMALTRSHLFWFNAPARLEELRPERGNQVRLSNCSVTTQGERAIVITERKAASKGKREDVTVEVLMAASHEEQREWVKVLMTCVMRDFSKDYLGIPYGVLTFRLDADAEQQCVIQLELMSGSTEGMEALIVSPPTAGKLYQVANGRERGAPITEADTVVLDGEQRVLYAVEGVGKDQLVFQFRSDTLQVDNVCSITVKRNTVATPPVASPRPSSARSLSQSATDTRAGVPPLKRSVSNVMPSRPSPRVPSSPRKLPPNPPGAVLRRTGPLPMSPRKLQKPPGPAPVPPTRRRPASDRIVASQKRVSPSSLVLPLSPMDASASRQGGLTAQVFLFQRVKRKLEDGRWQSVAEDVTRVQTPESLAARQELEGLLMDPQLVLVKALLRSCPITEADQVCQALVNVYESHGATVGLILDFVRAEVGAATHANTLFRTNSHATKMMKFYSALIGREFLQKGLGESVNAVLETTTGWEINPEKVPEGETLEENLERLRNMCSAFLSSVCSLVEAAPLEFYKISACLSEEVGAKFAENRHEAIGGFVFLRFFCPAIVAPESYGLSSTVPNNGARRGLTLVAKTLQKMSNGGTFNTREAFMQVLNPYLGEKLGEVQAFLDAMAVVPPRRLPTVTSVPKQVVVRSLDTIYKQIVLQKRKMNKAIPTALHEKIQDIIVSIGIPANVKRILNAQAKARQEAKGVAAAKGAAAAASARQAKQAK